MAGIENDELLADDTVGVVGMENTELLTDDDTVGVAGMEKVLADDEGLDDGMAGMENGVELGADGTVAGIENEELVPDCAYVEPFWLGGYIERKTVPNAMTPNANARRRLCSRCERVCVLLIMRRLVLDHYYTIFIYRIQ